MDTLLSTTYEHLKVAWSAGKGYKILGSLEFVAEAFASRAVSLTSTFTKHSTLQELDVRLRPAIRSADGAISPYIEKTAKYAEKKSEQLQPVVRIARKVLPVQTAASIVGYFLRLFTKNMESVGRFMLIKEVPETGAN